VYPLSALRKITLSCIHFFQATGRKMINCACSASLKWVVISAVFTTVSYVSVCLYTVTPYIEAWCFAFEILAWSVSSLPIFCIMLYLYQVSYIWWTNFRNFRNKAQYLVSVFIFFSDLFTLHWLQLIVIDLVANIDITDRVIDAYKVYLIPTKSFVLHMIFFIIVWYSRTRYASLINIQNTSDWISLFCIIIGPGRIS
jgi:hypothetical protein